MLLWTRSNSLLSKIIRSTTRQDCSHFSFVFEGPGRSGLMFESNLLGTHPCFLKTSLKMHTIVHQKNMPTDLETEDKIWDIIVEKYDDRSYDFLGAIYLGLYKLANRWFNVPMPLVNRWSQPGQYYCDELYQVLTSLPGFPQLEIKGGMQTPHDLWVKLN